MNRHLRSAFALTISLTVAFAAPGSSAWAQVARLTAPTAAPVAPAAGVAGAAPVKFSVPSLSQGPSLVLPGLSAPAALPKAAASQPGASLAEAARAREVVAVQAALALPAPASYASFKKDRAMPDETGPRRDGNPDSDEGIDPIGNPTRRGGEGGPDDTTDPDQNDRRGGDDGLFSGLKAAAAAPTASGLSRFFDGLVSRGAADLTVNGARGASARAGLSKAKDMPEETGPRRDGERTDDLDGLGNPQRRGGEGGPDDRSDPDFGGDRGGNSELFSMMSPKWTESLGTAGRVLSSWGGALTLTAAGLGLAAATGHITASFLTVAPLYAAFIIPSLILHEMGHAKAADKLGDPTARLQGRLGFSPRDLMSHISPLMTIAIPLLTLAFTGLLFGGAVPVPVNERNLARPTKDMAKIALAGPAVNAGLAVLGGGVAAAMAFLGAPHAAVLLAGSFVLFNVMLAVFNLLPFFPLDGHHVVRHVVANVFKAPRAAAWLDAHAGVQVYGLVLMMVYGGALVGSMVSGMTGLLLLPSALLSGVLAALPFSAPPAAVQPTAGTMPESKLVLVQLTGSNRPLGSDIHLGLIDTAKPSGLRLYASQQSALSAELEAAGLGAAALGAYGASAIASYRRINVATVRIPVSSADAFRAEMESRGHRVFENERRSIVRPIEDQPGYVRPEGFWGGISMRDTLKLSTADKVHEIARGRWGDPGVGWRTRLARLLLRLSGDAPAQPKVAVIDTGVDIEHPLVKPGLAGHKDVRPDGNGIDDDGHGTWVTSMVLNFAPWLRSITHYKAFTNGSASTDDVLKGLTMAANDGNIIMSNSWGDDGGDPDSPDSQLVQKLASEGRIMVFAAGNNGYAGANTVGSPAIASYKDARTGAVRVIAVAATDKGKKVVSFSSKGPGSAVTRRGGKWENYPVKPDAAEQGDNTEGAWPGGRTRSISGTSMSTPKFAGTIALLAQMFGVTETGDKLDKVVVAVMSTLTNEYNQSRAAIGGGFNAVKAAYDALVAQGLSPVAPGWAARLALWVAGGGR